MYHGAGADRRRSGFLDTLTDNVVWLGVSIVKLIKYGGFMSGTDFRAYRLQRFIGSHLVPDLRVSMCCRIAGFGASSVSMFQSDNTLRLRGVAYCESVWTCPVCSRMIRRTRADAVTELFRKTVDDGYRLHFVTLTFTLNATGSTRHDLRAMLRAQADAWRSMVQSKGFREWRRENGIVHYMRSLEITHGQRGWHPHFHLVYVSSRSAIDAERLFCLWLIALQTVGATMVWSAQNYQVVQDQSDTQAVAEYVTAWGAGLWSISQEMTVEKFSTRRIGSRTPMQLAADAMCGDDASVELFRLYAYATKGMRTTTFSRGWLSAYAIDESVNDDVITPEMLEGELLVSIDPDDYKKLGSYRESFFESVMLRDYSGMLLIARMVGLSGLQNISRSWFNVDHDWIWFTDDE